LSNLSPLIYFHVQYDAVPIPCFPAQVSQPIAANTSKINL
jgi:hypothetical protein